MSVTVNMDTVVNCAYITLSEQQVARTVEYNDHILVDVDAFELVVGIELLDLGTHLAIDDLAAAFHFHSDAVDLLRLIRPDVVSLLRLTSGTDGQSSATPRSELTPVT